MRTLSNSVLAAIACVSSLSCGSKGVEIKPPEPISVADCENAKWAVQFGDPAIAAEILKLNGQSSGLVLQQYLCHIKHLEVTGAAVHDLNGLQAMPSLETLDLRNNQIVDLSPLHWVHTLSRLWLESNKVSDLGPLTGLPVLSLLDVGRNKVTDLSPIQNLATLKILEVELNGLSDLAPIAGLVELRELDLHTNNISDITALGGLSKLDKVTLHTNGIESLAPLVASGAMGDEDVLSVHGNPLNQQACCKSIPVMIKLGADVDYGTACDEYPSCPAG